MVKAILFGYATQSGILVGLYEIPKTSKIPVLGIIELWIDYQDYFENISFKDLYY